MEEETWENALEKVGKEWEGAGNKLIHLKDYLFYFRFILTYLKLNYTLFKKEKKETG